MKICFIAPADNYHTIKWAKWFTGRGHEVHVISFNYTKLEYATVHYIDAGVKPTDRDLTKLKYLLKSHKIKELIDQIQPDIINVHYASSYGAAAALSGIKNYILSVWGSDIYDFPRKSILHKWMLQYSLRKAAYLFSTSQAMAGEAGKYTQKPLEITPFGVDTDLFSPAKRTRNKQENNDKNSFIIGTVKALTSKYGIDYLLKAASILRQERPDIPLKLRIAGKGTHENAYKVLASTLGIDNITTWLGYISQEQAAYEWANMDAGIIPSVLDSESFGVSALEVQACGLPVIISDVPGLMEATVPGKTSICVPRRDEKSLAKAIEILYDDPDKRREMGINGRVFVKKQFEINQCFEKIERIYMKIIRGA